MSSTPITVDAAFIESMLPFRSPDKGLGLIGACSKNIVVFAERMLGITLYSWQVYFLSRIQRALESSDDTSLSREFAAITSRQIGKSTALAVLGLWATIFNKRPGTISNNTILLIVSASDTQAKKLLYEIKKFIRLGDSHIKRTYVDDNGEPLFGTKFFTDLLDEYEPNNTTTITFKPHDPSVHGEYLLIGSKNGSVIRSYPPTSIVLGECQIGSDRVLLTDGSYKRIDEIQVGDFIVTSDHFKQAESTVTAIKDNGIVDTIQFTTSRGNSVTVTHNHPLMTERGWVKAIDIQPTDKLCQLIRYSSNASSYDWGERIPKFLGYMLGDGSCIQRTNLRFSQEDNKQKEEFNAICNSLNYSISWSKDKRTKNLYNASISVKAWDNILLESGLAGKDAGNKELPIGFEGWSKQSKALLLNRYFSCDGWFINNKKRPEIGVYSKSKKLINQIQHELLSWEIRSNIRKRVKGNFSGYELAIRYNKGIEDFIKYIGIFNKTDKVLLNPNRIYQHTSHDIQDFEFVNIRSIQHTGKQQTYGITIQDTQCYISNGILNHNTATLLAIDEVGKSDRIGDTFIYDYFFPVGNSTDAIRLYTSTPWTSSGFFYRIVDPDNLYKNSPVDVVSFTIDAIKIENPKYYATVQKTIKSMNEDGKHAEVQRGYYCRFVKGEQSYFDPTSVLESFTSDYTMFEEFSGECDMGVDFGGQVTSKTVITISYLDDHGTVRRLYHKSYPVGGDQSLMSDISNLLKRFNIQRIIPDDCPAGYHLIEKMKEKGWNVHPMNFRTDKVKKYGAFRSLLNRKNIKSYLDEDLQTEMLSMEFSQGSRQSVLQHAPGYTDDLIDSFVMSSYFFLVDDTILKTYNWYGD